MKVEGCLRDAVKLHESPFRIGPKRFDAVNVPFAIGKLIVSMSHDECAKKLVMIITNRYVRHSRISEAKFREFVKCFSLDLVAHQTALLLGLNRNTVNRYLLFIRTRIAEFCERSSPFHGEVEVDESYFGAKRIKGKRGRGAYSKTPVFGILQRSGMVYTEILPDCAKQTLQTIIRGR